MQADPKLALFSITHSRIFTDQSIYESCKHVVRVFFGYINTVGNWMGAL